MNPARFAIAILIVLAIAPALAEPINEVPMYGGRPKSAEMIAADNAFLETIRQRGLSRADGAKEAVRLGWSYLWQKKDPATAMKRFNQAWLLDPENGNIYHGFAVLTSVRGGQPAEVERLFQLAIAKPDVDVLAFVDYGRFLWTQRQLDQSLAQLNKALKISSSARNARANISFVHYLKSDFAAACVWAMDAQRNGDSLEKGYLEDMCRRAGKA
jgi:Tfp pilus assembly protein PilF